MCRMPKTLPHSRPGLRMIYLSNYIYILVFGVEEGLLVRRDYIFNW